MFQPSIGKPRGRSVLRTFAASVVGTALLVVLLCGSGGWSVVEAAAVSTVASGDWYTPGIWSGGAVPTAADTVTISDTFPVVSSSGGGSQSVIVVSSLQIGVASGSSLTFSAGTRNITVTDQIITVGTSVLTLNPNANLTSRGISASANFGGSFTLTAGSVTCFGTNPIVSAGAVVTVGSGASAFASLTVATIAAGATVNTGSTSAHIIVRNSVFASGAVTCSSCGHFGVISLSHAQTTLTFDRGVIVTGSVGGLGRAIYFGTCTITGPATDLLGAAHFSSNVLYGPTPGSNLTLMASSVGGPLVRWEGSIVVTGASAHNFTAGTMVYGRNATLASQTVTATVRGSIGVAANSLLSVPTGGYMLAVTSVSSSVLNFIGQAASAQVSFGGPLILAGTAQLSFAGSNAVNVSGQIAMAGTASISLFRTIIASSPIAGNLAGLFITTSVIGNQIALDATYLAAGATLSFASPITVVSGAVTGPGTLLIPASMTALSGVLFNSAVVIGPIATSILTVTAPFTLPRLTT